MSLADIHVSSTPSLVLAVLGIAAILGAALAIGRASLVKAQLEALRGDRDDLVARVNILEAGKVILEAEVKEEKAARVALEKVITARDQIEKISTVLDLHDKRAERMEKVLTSIQDTVGAA